MTQPSRDDPFSSSLPETFGPFRVLHQIGAGVLGPLFRTQQIDSKRLAAIKIFKLDLTPEQVDQLAGELARLVETCLDHPALVRPMAAGADDGRVYLAQEYVVGESLDVPLRLYRTFPVEDVLRLVAGLAAALDAAAASGVYHGRLHPRDVMIVDGDVKLTGLGIAQAVEAVGVTVPVRRAYAAPERLAASRWGRAADCFALGALAYELLLGRRLVSGGEAAADQIRAVARDEDLPLTETLAVAVAPEPADRFCTAAEFAAALERAAWRTGRIAPPSMAIEAQPVAPVVNQPAVAAASLPDAAAPAFAFASAPSPADGPAAATPDSTHAGHALPLRAAGPTPDPDEIGWRHVPEPGRPRRQRLTLGAGAAIAALVALAIGYQLVSRSLPRVGQPSADLVVAEGEREWTEREVPADAAPSEPAPAAGPERAPPSAPPSPGPPAPAVASSPSTSGRMLVRSTPAGAVVIVNGERRGLTPLAVRGLPLGSHTVRVSRPGYPPADRQVRITRARPAQSLTIVLEPVRARPTVALTRVGSVGVRSRPVGASVYLDGRLVGTTPLVISSVRAGAHVVRIEKAGYRRWSTSVSVVPGARIPVSASLDGERSR